MPGIRQDIVQVLKGAADKGLFIGKDRRKNDFGTYWRLV